MTTPKPTPPVEAVGVVTREHRLAAYRAERRIEAPPFGSTAERWVAEGGESYRWSAIAQAIADAEARGEARASRSDGAEHRAWAEGYEAALDDAAAYGASVPLDERAPNPYPAASASRVEAMGEAEHLERVIVGEAELHFKRGDIKKRTDLYLALEALLALRAQAKGRL